MLKSKVLSFGTIAWFLAAVSSSFAADGTQIPTLSDEKPKLGKNTALIMVDVQNDFMPLEGAQNPPAGYKPSLVVPKGNEVIPALGQYADEVKAHGGIVAATMDYHPEGHISFKSAGKGGIWPDHCVQGSFGGEIAPSLQNRVATQGGEWIFRKGYLPDKDAYSGFDGGVDWMPGNLKSVVDRYKAFEQNGSNQKQAEKKIQGLLDLKNHGLAGRLKKNGIKSVVIGGLATDYCVKSTAEGALKAGFKVYILVDGSRGVDVKPGDSAKALAQLQSEGAVLIRSDTGNAPKSAVSDQIRVKHPDLLENGSERLIQGQGAE